MENYFNYFTEIEEYFQRRRGTLFTGVAPYRARERGVVMTTAMGRAGLSVIKAYQQRTWASGDYAVVAARIVLASEQIGRAHV